MKTVLSLPHMPSLDGLRGVSILAVMLGHANHILFRGGTIGVDVFFCLSGFLITSLLLIEWEDRRSINFRRFYLRRALRLFPALMVLLVFSVLYAELFFAPAKRNEVLLAALSSFCYVTNWLQAFGWLSAGAWGLGHTWSLSIEEQFYLLWPVALLGLLKWRTRPWGVIAVLAVLVLGVSAERTVLWDAGRTFQRLYFGLDTRADSLLAGSIAGMIGTWRLVNPDLRAVRAALRAASALSVLFLGYGILAIRWPADQMQMFLGKDGGFTVIAVSVAFILLWLRLYSGSLLHHFLEFRALVEIGRISYGLYLWHFFIFVVIDDHMPSGGWVVIVGLKFGLSFAAALISYQYVETPFLRWKARLSTLPSGRVAVS